LTYSYNVGDEILLNKTGGTGTGKVIFKVIDPNFLTGNEYEVVIEGIGDTLSYSVYNLTTGDTLITSSKDFSADFTSKEIIDGFVISVQDDGRDSINALAPALKPFRVKSVTEVKGPGGVDLATPIDLLNNLNSTGKWRIKTSGLKTQRDSVDLLQNIDWENSLGFRDYEIRFTQGGSEYYTTGYAGANPPRAPNPKGVGRVPFEIWDVGGFNEPSEPLRNFIKTWDEVLRDTLWSQDPASGDWEGIFSYVGTVANPDTGYTEPIAPLSGAVTAARGRLGNFIISGELPAEGTIIRIETYKPLSQGDKFSVIVPSANTQNLSQAKNNLDKISVFPNPYFGANSLERDKYQRFVRFTNLPTEVTIRIFSLSGVFIQTLVKSNTNQYLDWDLRNRDGLPVASGVYLTYIDMPGVGTKIMKIAVIMETQYIDRL
jgi:hypothetical protein